jgi:hypothetical protein
MATYGFYPQDLFFCFVKWQDGYHDYSGDELNSILNQSQTITFFSIVIMQTGKNKFINKI